MAKSKKNFSPELDFLSDNDDSTLDNNTNLTHQNNTPNLNIDNNVLNNTDNLSIEKDVDNKTYSLNTENKHQDRNEILEIEKEVENYTPNLDIEKEVENNTSKIDIKSTKPIQVVIRAKEYKQTGRINLVIDYDMLEKFNQICDRLDMKRNHVINEFIYSFVEANKDLLTINNDN